MEAMRMNGDRNHRNQRRMPIRCKCGSEAWSKANPGKLYYACTIKGPNCDWIGWVNDHKCDCKYFTMKLEAENRNLKLFLIISWMFFFCLLLCTNYRCSSITDHCNQLLWINLHYTNNSSNMSIKFPAIIFKCTKLKQEPQKPNRKVVHMQHKIQVGTTETKQKGCPYEHKSQTKSTK
ncbi:hypothetical protein LXL04_036767 [Taraxacum kok-saghyz]